ncbi:hypothetical protein, partial [Bradyrhizobium liaoningense]
FAARILAAVRQKIHSSYCPNLRGQLLTAVITERLYSYYRQRPLAGATRKKFEELVVTLEMRLAGKSRPRVRGNYLSALKKKAFKEPKS